VPPTVDHYQRAALRRLQAALGDVQVLAVQPREPAGGAGTPPPSLASQQLALTIQTPPALPARTHHPTVGQARLPDPSTE
jgi:hypothetical protein